MKFDLSKVKYSKWDIKRKITIPNSPSEKLAEEMAIHLGDGYLFYDKKDKSYRYGVGLNPHTEREYAEYVSELLYNLYNVKLNVNNSRIETMSLAIGTFKHLVLSFPIGKRTSYSRLPNLYWILSKDLYVKAFIRGLIDTEGCIKKLSRTIGVVVKLRHRKLTEFYKNCLETLGFKPRLYKWIERNKVIYSVYVIGHDNVSLLINLINLKNSYKLNKALFLLRT